MTVQEKAAFLQGVAYEGNETMFDMLAETVEDEILAYCNIDAVPDGQANTQAQMIAFKYNARHGAGLSGASYRVQEKWTKRILHSEMDRYTTQERLPKNVREYQLQEIQGERKKP